jgi:hypothetical protein
VTVPADEPGASADENGEAPASEEE